MVYSDKVKSSTGCTETAPSAAAANCPFPETGTSKFQLRDRQGIPVTFSDAQDRIILSKDALSQCLENEFDLRRLERIQDYLWWAGRPVPANALHRQKLLRREIYPTQRADLHLLRIEYGIYIKPLPSFLLDYKFWVDHLCQSPKLQLLATGFLVSWIWLLRGEIDFDLALKLQLIPPELHWDGWVHFVESFSSTYDFNQTNLISRRYLYGELRISRLNHIYRVQNPLSFRSVVFAYGSGYISYTEFFTKNFSWIFVGFAYISVLLSALQVGLGTDHMGQSRLFQRFSLAITSISLVLPLFTLVLFAILFLVLFILHFLSGMTFYKKRVSLRSEWNKVS
jgi:hypothetical protein